MRASPMCVGISSSIARVRFEIAMPDVADPTLS